MVHTRHSFKESFKFNSKKREDGRRRSRIPREDVDYNTMVNGVVSKPHSQPPKKRKYNTSNAGYIYDSHDEVPRGHNRFTRNSQGNDIDHYDGTVSIDGSIPETSRKSKHKNDGLNNIVGSFSEPRRSCRQRREVYETLNEKLLVWNKVSNKKVSGNGEKEPKRSMYDFVKQRKRTDTEENEDDEEEENDDEDDDDDDDDDDEDDDEDDETEEQEEDQGSQERPYSFRERRQMTRRYSAPPIAGKSRRSEALYNAVPHSPMHKRRHRKMPQHGGGHKRKHYGSSTSSSGDSDDEHRFERRKAKSMAKARARCLPMNFNPGDVFGVLKDRERASGRQPVGSSLADVDPMNIDKGVTFESVGGLDKHIQSLKEMIVFPLLYPEVFEKFKIAPPRGVLFYGPPGTGKTLVARALANECSSEGHKVAFFMRKGADCLSKWVGESERQLRLLFDQAYSMRPSIIFFDEIDGLAPVRSTRQDQIHSSIVSTLLALMDGLDSRGEVIVIGATNRIDSIDPALRRPGRFDREFLFTLPNRVARRSILDIHTREWQPKLSKNFVNELADLCVGYCGADIKALCTEAALIALRRRYPQIYGTNKKLVLDVDNITISVKDFQYAMGKVVPASQRSAVSPARSLGRIMKPLLESTLDTVLQRIRSFFPVAHPVNEPSSATTASKSMPSSLDADTSDEDEAGLPSIYEPLSYGRSTRATQRASSPPTEPNNFLDIIEQSQMKKLSHRARFLIAGREGMSQSTHIAPAIMYSMEHLKFYVLDLPSLFGVSARVPEEACSQVFTEARRTAPCVIYLPHIETWWDSISDTCRATFLTLLSDLPASLPVFLLSTSNCTFDELPAKVRQLFSSLYEEIFEVTEPTESQRRLFFRDLLLKNAIQPTVAQKTTKLPKPLEILPVAPPPPKRQLSDLELKNLRDMEENTLRELRLFLRQIVWKLMADRKFKEFMKPVDLEEVPDYYEVIKDPMDLSTLMTNINSHKYVSCAQFLTDVDLITNNCLEYNPDRDTYDRLLRNRACELRDTAHAMIYADLDPEFEKMCEEIHESRQKRDESEEIFAPSYIRVLQKNPLPIRATGTTDSQRAGTNQDGDQQKMSAVGTQSGKDTKKNLTPERPTRQSRRLKGEESVDIPSFSTPIETIIRSPDGKRRRGKKPGSSKNNDTSDPKVPENESNKKGEDVFSVDAEIKIEGVDKMDVSIDAESGTVEEEKGASLVSEKDIAEEEKSSRENSFVVVKSVKSANSRTEEGKEEKEDEEAIQNPEATEQSTVKNNIANEVDMPASADGKAMSSSSPLAVPLGTDESMQITDGHPSIIHCDDSKVVKVQSGSAEQDDKSLHESLGQLLDRLVASTDAASVSFLEKTYFSVNNLIYRSRKNPDRSALLADLDGFITKLAAER